MNYCTYFDSGYMAQGMACIRSLQRWDNDAWIAVLALDKRAYDAIPRGPGIRVVLQETAGAENIWRLTPGWIRRAMDLLNAPAIAYVDADMYAFSPLAPVWEECLQEPVAIVPHRWTPKYAERLRPNGKYNVGWLTVRNTGEGVQMLERWERYCRNWKPTPEQSRFMDQRFFDDPPVNHDAWHIVENLGVNLAPYNQEQYEYTHGPNGLGVSDGMRCDRLALYHFHEWRCKRGPNDAVTVLRHTGYQLAPAVAEYVYPQYEREAMQYAI